MKTKSILIIDDEKDLCELIRLILKDQNYKVVCAFSLAEGKRKWSRMKPAVILLDQNLPDGSGLGFVEQNPSFLLNSKVIMITADTRPDIKIRAEIARIDHFIQKPFSLKLIRELLKEIYFAFDTLTIPVKAVGN
ncbi:MAG TPA: response regulator [Puia sp.]|nr:response regulator [Puia sp.]